MNRFITFPALVLLAGSAMADDSGYFTQWDINGYNTARYDNYHTNGNKAASPYAFGGSHFYDEFNLNASRQFSPFERFRMSVFGVVNDSDYRAVDNGLVPERFNLFYENGETAIPFRVEAGDFFAGISYRTLQRTLKGASVELQPFGDNQTKHSFLLFSGANQPTYRSFSANDDYYSGGSWLIEDKKYGRLSANIVHAVQDEPNGALTGTNNQQLIYSLAGETQVDAGSQRLTLEGEVSRFDGDYALLEDQNDMGYFAQLSGRDSSNPLDYRFRFERYGTSYRPNGAIITPDRQSYEGHAGWRFDSGTYLRGRLQRFEDNFDSTNEQQTDVAGINLSGPLFSDLVAGMSGNIDLYRQDIDNDLNTVNTTSDTLNAVLNFPISGDLTGQLSTFLQDVEDDTTTNADSITRQVGLSVFMPIEVAGLTGSINPGFVLRDLDFKTSANSVEFNPTIGLSLADDMHRISANYGYLNQNRMLSGTGADTAIQTAGLDYALTLDEHELGINADYYERDISLSQNTDAYRIGAYWTLRFHKPVEANAPRSTNYAANSNASPVGAPALHLGNATLLKDIAPGEKLKRARALLAESSITKPTRRSGVSAYETVLLDEVTERQRLVLEHGKTQVKRTGLVIDVADTGSPRSVMQLYERIKERLADAYGAPKTVFEEGDFTDNIVADINSQKLIRVVEWETANGTLRYGLPRRLDGQVRIELIHAKRFKSPRDTLWGMKVY